MTPVGAGIQVHLDPVRIRERKQQIQAKYTRDTRLDSKDLRELAKLNRQEKYVSADIRCCVFV